eukprot:COSAG01_NODE_27451_length_685_cov_1.498294_2_plen_120_part_01
MAVVRRSFRRWWATLYDVLVPAGVRSTLVPQIIWRTMPHGALLEDQLEVTHAKSLSVAVVRGAGYIRAGGRVGLVDHLRPRGRGVVRERRPAVEPIAQLEGWIAALPHELTPVMLLLLRL